MSSGKETVDQRQKERVERDTDRSEGKGVRYKEVWKMFIKEDGRYGKEIL